MKVFSNDYTLDYSWEEVSVGIWRKYCPWNHKSTHVIAVDTLSREVDPETGLLWTERLITVKQPVPEWLRFGCKMDESLVLERCTVDPTNQTVKMVSKNVTIRNLVSTRELITYTPMSKNETRFDQYAEITAVFGGWQRIKNSTEDFLVKLYRENAAKGREGFQAVLEMSRRAFAEEREREQELNIRQAQAA